MIEWYGQPHYQPFSLIHDDERKDRAVAMMIHGFTGTPDEMRPTAHIAYDAGFDVEVIGLPGMGADIGRLRDARGQDWLAHVLESWRDLTARYRRRLLVGYSLGAALAIQASVSRPADAMVFMSPLIRLADPRSVALPILRHFRREMAPFGEMDFSQPDVQEFFQRTMPGLDMEASEVQQSMRADFVMPTRLLNDCRIIGRDAGRQARFVEEPVTIIQGRPDDVVGHANARWLVDHLAGPVSYHEVPGDHLIAYDGARTWPEVRPLLVEAFTRFASDGPS